MTQIWQGLQSPKSPAVADTRGSPDPARPRRPHPTRLPEKRMGLMKSSHPRLRRADAAVWIVISLGAAAIAGFALWAPFAIEWRSFLAPATLAVLLAAGGRYYRAARNEARLGAILNCTAQIIGFAAVAAPLSYIAATAGFPLRDSMLDAWDHHLGFDWTATMSFIAARPALALLLLLAYSSFALQTVTTVLALGVAGQLDRLGTFVAAFVCTTLITIAGSAVYPAAGPYLFLELQPAAAHGFLPVSSTSWPVFLGLRDGTLHTVYGLNSEGIITFPSLHAALGILFAAALWRVAVVRWIALALNGAMLIATPAYGSHYVVDVIAGVAIAIICWLAVARFVRTGSDAAPEPLAGIADAPSIVPEAVAGTESAASRKLEST